MSADSNGRNWCWADDAGDIVVKAQPAIAIYPGPSGVVIRRRADWPDEDDELIWFDVGQARAVAAAILEAAGLDAADIAEPAQDPTKPKDPTAAGRQRRRRARQIEEPTLDIDRDADRDIDRDTVTETVTDTVTRDAKDG